MTCFGIFLPPKQNKTQEITDMHGYSLIIISYINGYRINYNIGGPATQNINAYKIKGTISLLVLLINLKKKDIYSNRYQYSISKR